MFETIVALATAPMKSALAIIRMSGRECFQIFSLMFSKNVENTSSRSILYGNIIDGERHIDEVIVNIYVSPASFTGENLVEIMCHGSSLITSEIIELAIKHGARMATHGEFSSRAFLNKKIDLIQAEAINDTINATTSEAKDLSLMSLTGKTSSLLMPIKTILADLLSQIEVNIDYPEYQDIEEVNAQRVIKDVDKLKLLIRSLIQDGKMGQIIKDGIKVAIVGKPNVGKSSLLNILLSEEKAIVTDIAGTTRDIVEGSVNVGGVVLHLLDTAGIRKSNDIIENIGIEKSYKAISKADLVILVLDATTGIEKEDSEILELVKHKKVIMVYNKSELKTSPGIMISAKNGDIKALIDEIKQELGLSERNFSSPSLNSARQIGLLDRINCDLTKAMDDANNALPIDLISVSLLNAYNTVLELLGETNYNDLSAEIFSRFCVGK